MGSPGPAPHEVLSDPASPGCRLLETWLRPAQDAATSRFLFFCVSPFRSRERSLCTEPVVFSFVAKFPPGLQVLGE